MCSNWNISISEFKELGYTYSLDFKMANVAQDFPLTLLLEPRLLYLGTEIVVKQPYILATIFIIPPLGQCLL